MKTEWNNIARTIAFVMSLAILHPKGLLAQVIVSAPSFNGGTITTAILAGDGSASAPSYSFSGQTTTGMYRNSSSIVFSVAGSNRTQMTTTGFGIFGGSSTLVTMTTDGTTDKLQLGVDTNGAPAPQTIKSHDGITGTDVAGANLIIESGRGTGAGTVSTVTIGTPTVLGSGTTAQTNTTRVTVSSAGTVIAPTAAGDIGWSVVAGADTACNTTCTQGCVIGFATDALGGSNPVACTSATADNCLCAGSS